MPRFILLPLPFLVWLAFSERVRPWLAAVPPAWLLVAQAFRVPVEICLWLFYAGGFGPEAMTFEGWNFDILSGLLGPLVAWGAFGGGRYRPQWAVAYHVFGLLLLVNVLAIAFFSFPTPWQAFTPGIEAAAGFPTVWLPTVLVPTAYTLHLFSWRQLALLAKQKARAVIVSG